MFYYHQFFCSSLGIAPIRNCTHFLKIGFLVFIPIISTKGINQIKKGKKRSFMHIKIFNIFSKIWVQFCVGAIPRLPFFVTHRKAWMIYWSGTRNCPNVIWKIFFDFWNAFDQGRFDDFFWEGGGVGRKMVAKYSKMCVSLPLSAKNQLARFFMDVLKYSQVYRRTC